ncbi:MAG: hypothetical protein ABIY90_04135 [Puia sp.]
MKSKKLWINLSILNLCIVAFLGLLLRTKIIFPLHIVNYNHLLDSHSHFAFGGWVTFTLILLMVYELLPASLYEKPIYQWIFGIIVIISWLLLFIYYFNGNGFLSRVFSTIFILITYVFGWIFIHDVQKSKPDNTILLLVIVSILSLILSSVGPFTLDYLFTTGSRNAILYRDALFTYLHLQYNGFFTLAVFALLFHRLQAGVTLKSKQNNYRFAVLLVISILPSLFLSYLWHDPNRFFRCIAIAGSFFIFFSLIWFLVASPSLIRASKALDPIVKYLLFLSMSAFILKMLLQTFTILPIVGDAVFGNRPIIIGFLHLVFLGFTSLFILAYFAQERILNINRRFTKLALITFSLGVVLNEAILMTQGLGNMFLKSSFLTPWLLWAISIFLFIGALLIAVARIRFSTSSV